jgi:ribose transport system permease protein
VRLSGVPVQWFTMFAYVICGLTAAMAGICDASRQTLGDPEAGLTYELDAIAAVVIGGTSLRGGRGGVPMTLLGVMIVGVVDKLLSMHGQDLSIRLMAKGLIIVVAVLIQGRSE